MGIRQVTKLTRSTDTGNYSSAMVSAQFKQGYGAGTYAYRHNAAKAIEYGLEHLSNDVVCEVTATKSKSGGKILENAERTATGGAKATEKLFAALTTTTNPGDTIAFADAQASPAASKPAAGSAGVGDILRIHGQDGMTQIEGVTGGDDASITSFTLDPWLGSSTDAGTLAVNN